MAGPPSGVLIRLVIPPEATRPRQSRVQATPTDRVTSGAQKSVRSVQCGSQATALTHQGPQEEWDAASPGTTTARGRSLGSSIWREQNASIIAPRREGSQLGGADTPRPVGIRKISRALALLPHEGISRRQYLWSPMEALRLSRPVVKGVNRAQSHQGPLNLGEPRALALLPRGGDRRSSIGDRGLASASIIAPGREGSQLWRHRPSWSPPKPLTAEEKANLWRLEQARQLLRWWVIESRHGLYA